MKEPHTVNPHRMETTSNTTHTQGQSPADRPVEGGGGRARGRALRLFTPEGVLCLFLTLRRKHRAQIREKDMVVSLRHAN